MSNDNLYIKKPIPVHAVQMAEPFEVKTLEGTMKGKAGDYLITGIREEQYPCDREIFEESYVPWNAEVTFVFTTPKIK